MAAEADKDKPSSAANPIHLTEAAVAKIKSILTKEEKEDYGLRVDVVPGGCAGLSYELRFQKKAYENDLITQQGDIPIFMNAESVKFLHGTEIDYKDTLKESGFIYKNPNAKSSCGCGISFS